MKTKLQKGYAALVTVLIIVVLVVLIGTSTSLLSINEVQTSLAAKKNEEAVYVVEACAEEALKRLNTTATLPSSVTLPEGTCSVTTNSHTGNEWDFTVTHTLETYTKNLTVVATRSGSTTVTSWGEVE